MKLELELESLEVHRCIPADREYLIFLFASVRAASEPLKVVQVALLATCSSFYLQLVDGSVAWIGVECLPLVAVASALSLHSRINNAA